MKKSSKIFPKIFWRVFLALNSAKTSANFKWSIFSEKCVTFFYNHCLAAILKGFSVKFVLESKVKNRVSWNILNLGVSQNSVVLGITNLNSYESGAKLCFLK